MDISSTLSLPKLLVMVFFLPTLLLVKGERFNVVDFGAIPDGKTDSSAALLGAWKAACNVDSGWSVPTTIYVPPGRYLIEKVLILSGRDCKPMVNNKGIIIRIDGTLVAPADYMAFEGANTWLSFQNVAGVTISGGAIDGLGGGLWACKADGMNNCPSGTTTLSFTNSRDIIVSGLISLNSQLYHIVINGCTNVKLQGLRVLAAGNSPNTDGIHVQLSTNVMILNSKIGTGDDCVSVGAGTSNLFIDNVICGPGHGISIGSLGKDLNEAGVENVTVTRVFFKNTQNGVRIKSWGRPSSGFARNVLFRKITMDNVYNPIIIDQNYCPFHYGCPEQVSGVKINDVTYQDIYGSSATEVAVKFDCSSEYPCSDIKMDNVKLTYKFKDRPALSSCANASGTVAGIIEPVSCIIET